MHVKNSSLGCQCLFRCGTFLLIPAVISDHRRYLVIHTFCPHIMMIKRITLPVSVVGCFESETIPTLFMNLSNKKITD